MSRRDMPKVNVDVIRSLCKEKGITIGKLENELGIARGYIHKWGEHDVSYHYLKQCSEILGVTIEALYER